MPGIDEVFEEYARIETAIAAAHGEENIAYEPLPFLDTTTEQHSQELLRYFCGSLNVTWSEWPDYPQVACYQWTAETRYFRSPFEAFFQCVVVRLLLTSWREWQMVPDKPVLLRLVNTGGFQLEVHEGRLAHYICLSHQFFHAINQFGLLNKALLEAGWTHGCSQKGMVKSYDLGGAFVEQALRHEWAAVSRQLDEFIATLEKTANYECERIIINECIRRYRAEVHQDDRYARFRDFTPGEPQRVPVSLQWAHFSDDVIGFCLAHELSHIFSGDLKSRERSLEEELQADQIAVKMLVATAYYDRGEHDPGKNGYIAMGPILFFGMSRIFTNFDNTRVRGIGKKYYRDIPDLATHWPNASSSEHDILSRRLYDVIVYLAGSKAVEDDTSASICWDVAGEMFLHELAILRRRRERANMSCVPLDEEIREMQVFLEWAKGQTAVSVARFFPSNSKING